MLWNCPCHPPPDKKIAHRATLPAAFSVSLILQRGADAHEIENWRETCFSALKMGVQNLARFTESFCESGEGVRLPRERG